MAITAKYTLGFVCAGRNRALAMEMRLMWRPRDSGIDDRRKTVRYAAGGVVHVQGLLGGPLRDCRLTDISDGGVRLYAEGVSVPEEFVLWLAQDNAQRRRCRVIWRLGHEVGAAFSDQPQENFALRTALGQFGSRR